MSDLPRPDPDFQSRMRAYELARGKGRMFYANDPLGRGGQHHIRRSSLGRRLKGAMLVLVALVFLKSALFVLVGAQTYSNKIEPFAQSEAVFDKVVFAVMQPDPVTMAFANFYGQTINAVRSIARSVAQ